MSESNSSNHIPGQNADSDSFPHISRPDQTEAIGAQIGPYKVLSFLGEGGFGIVYLAQQKKPVKRQVALKVIKPGMDSKQVIARFEAEQQALAVLNHPNIARVIDAGTTEQGRLYFAMEYVKGRSVTEYCDQEKLAIEDRLQLFIQICEAVQHAHQKGIIHRDIKPSNILVSVQAGQAVPKIIDFGVAKALSQPLTERTLFTEQGQLIGTPEYMSPEQAEVIAQDVDTRSDVYSLGVVLYELLSGALPFDPKTLRQAAFGEIQRIIREEEPPRPSTRISSLGDIATEIAQKRHTDVRKLIRRLHSELEWIPLKAMRKEPDRRYATAHALAEDIQKYLDGAPLIAGPESKTYRARKFVRRNRTLVVSALLVIVALAFGIIQFSLLQIKKADLAEVEAKTALTEAEAKATRAEAEAKAAIAEARASIAEKEAARIQAEKETLLAEAEASRALAEAERMLWDAEKLRNQGKYDEALEKLTSIDQNSPNRNDARLLRVRLRVEQQNVKKLTEPGRYAEAIAELKGLLTEPNLPREISCVAHYILAEISPTDSEIHQAEGNKLLEEGLSDDSAYAQCYYLRGLTAGTPKETINWLNKALDYDPTHYAARKTLTMAYQTNRDYVVMARHAEAMIATRPGDGYGFAYRAIARRETGNLENAISDHNRAIKESNKVREKDPDLYRQRFRTHMLAGNYDEALLDARVCVELRPDDRVYRFDLFCALVALGRYEQAKAKYIEFIQSHSTKRPSYWAKADFRRRCERLVFNALSTKQHLNLPENSENEEAFWPIFYAFHCHKNLAAKAERKVVSGFTASWSPDGKKLAYGRVFTGYDDRPNATSNGIEILDLESGKTRLIAVPGKDPAWSPDGKYIAFVREVFKEQQSPSQSVTDEKGEQSGWVTAVGALGHTTTQELTSDNVEIEKDEIWIIDPNGSEPVFLTKGGFPSWSSDSKRLYFNSREKEGGKRYLYRISIEDPNAKSERLLPTAYYGVVSPDEKYFAYGSYYRSDGRRGINIVELSSGSPVASWKGPLGERGLLVQWSPDGRELSIGGYDDSNLGLWIYDIETKTASKVLNGPITLGCWSPRKDRIAFDVRGGFFEIWIAEIDPNVPTVESLGPSLDTDAHYTYLTNLYIQSINANALDTDMIEWIKRLRSNLGSQFRSYYKEKMYVEALGTLEQYSRLDAALSKRYTNYRGAIDLFAVIAELHYRVGNIEQANVALEKFRVKCRKPSSRNYLKYLVKAEKLLAGSESSISVVWEHLEKGDLDNASELLLELMVASYEDDPYFVGRLKSAQEQLVKAYVRRSRINDYNKEYLKAIDDLEMAIRFDPNHINANNGIAWLKATCPKVEFRDGAMAIEKASKACELTDWKNWVFLDTLAAAYAETGDYEQAMKWQKETIKNLPEKPGSGTREDCEARLRLYEQRRPYHQQYLWPNQLVAHYTFDKVEGDKVFDSSSHGINGMLRGNAQIVEDPIRGKVLKLDGKGDWVDCGADMRFDLTEKLTVSAWVKTTEFDKKWQAIVTKGELAWRLQRDAETDSIEFSCTGLTLPEQRPNGGYLPGKMKLNDGMWHHLVGVYDGTAMTLYVDGNKDVQKVASGQIRTNSYRLLIGANAYYLNSSPREWEGLIDDVRIYSYALNEHEIKKLYANTESIP